MKIALFAFLPQFPSAQIRVIEPLRHWTEELELYGGIEWLRQNRGLGEMDLLLVQREFPGPKTQAVCEAIVSSGKPIVYETDDYLQRVPKHHNKPEYNEEKSTVIEWFAKQSDLVTVSTEPLAAVYREFAREVLVLPNYLSPRLWNDTLTNRREIENARIRIGLVGSSNHDQDFSMLAGLIEETLATYPEVEFVFYGALPGNISPHDRISVIPANYNYELHPQRLASLGLDIGLVPLTPSKFNRAKSNIKFLEFGFLGIPALYADLEPYRDSVIHGETGFLCGAKPSEWRSALFSLIENAHLRQQIGEKAQHAVLSNWMLADRADQWLDAYRRAIGLREIRNTNSLPKRRR